MKPLKKALSITLCLFTLTLAQATTTSASTYTVAKDDSLFKIGSMFQVPINTLIADNYLNTDIIYPGQTLFVPSKVHQVTPGDTLYQIARSYDISLTSLRKANHKWDNLLLVGDKLLVPGIPPQSNIVQDVSSTKSSTTINTNEASKSASISTQKTLVSYTEKEVDLLARLITAEAGGESYEAMVAVGGVVVNRVLSDVWPDSITDVIYHVAAGYYQFTPVLNGQINKTATAEARKAAWDALYGNDPSNEALFFFDTSTTNDWLKSKPVTAKINTLVFAR